MGRPKIVAAALAALPLAACVAGGSYPTYPTPAETLRLFGHLGPVPVAAGNPTAPAKVRLGALLFEDTRLSADGSLSCASCHRPDQAFTVAERLSPAFPTRVERRNVPTLINVAYKKPLLWDGRSPSLEDQPLGTIADSLHFNNDQALVSAQLAADPATARAFRIAFGEEGVSGEKIAKAIAAYERTLVYDDSPFDRYMDGERDALSEAQRRGLGLFVGKARCVTCHGGPNLTDEQFHNLGVPDDPVRHRPSILAVIRFDAVRMGLPADRSVDEDLGRELVTKKAEDRGRFRTMSLRNVAQTGPYMHNGAFASLEDVVAFYDAGGGRHRNKSTRLRPLGLTRDERADLVAFLEGLSGRPRPEREKVKE